ncbi:hypothetical protein WA026_007059 [Henosepilachna vigintioctopunctata]|uniref:Uncharacterized protein n=1 Tax=Henosepilachna vigintioctopunctata TaxID=420089 RepID=A0AAW1V7Z7_9CUCU
MEDDIEKLSIWIKEGSWMSCDVIENKFKIARLSKQTDSAQENIQPNADSLNLFPDEDISSITENSAEDIASCSVPYLQEDKANNSENEHLFITLNNNYKEFQAKDNGKAVAFFIVHILSSVVDERCYRFNGFGYKKVIIFGIITEIFPSKMNSITVDDGTGQLKCHIEDCVNKNTGIGKYRSSNSSLDEMNLIFHSKLKELYENLPSFENLHIGDRVCVSGNISFHNGYFHLFVDKLQRHTDLEEHIKFMKRVFYLYENSYYSDR